MKNKTVRKIYTVYSAEGDMTFIMKDTYKGEDVVSTECVGWHFGEAHEGSEEFIGKLKAKY